MMSKYFSSKFFLGISFYGSLLSLTLFTFLRFPFLFPSLGADAQKNFIFISLGLISSLSFFVYLVMKKEVVTSSKLISTLLYLLIPISIVLSTIFSPSLSNSIFGKYISSSNLVFFSSLILSVYIISAYLKREYRSWTWLIITLSSLLLTIPVILAIILLRLNLTNVAPYFAYLISSWDVVATISALIVVISLVYYETIAFSSKQRFISLALIIIHLILITLMIIPDIWYAITLSSLGILLISFVHKKADNKKILNKLSFYVFIVALFFSVIFSLANTWSKATTFTQNVANFSAKYTGINYSFVKPKLNLSFNLGVSSLKKGKIFGSGLNEFNSVWQKEKPQIILESAYWNTEFISSYSAMTTLFVTIGLFGVLSIIVIISSLVYGVVKDIKKKDGSSNLDQDEENRFYFLSSIALFIFSTALLFLFVNIGLSIIIFALSCALLSSHITNWKENTKVSEALYLLFFVALLVILSGAIININRARASSIVSSASNNFQKDNDLDKLETALLRAARIANDDANYRLLTQFYLFKTQQLISASSTDTADLQKKVLTSLNNAISSSKTAISLDLEDYNNYMSLGSVYSFSMDLDKQNKDAYYKNAKDIYTEALKRYPKNPSIALTIAQLNYSYTKDASSTIIDIKKSLEIKPNYSDAFYTLSQLSSQNNDRASALNYAIQAIQADQTNENAYMQLGILSLSTKEPTRDDLNNAYLAFSTVLQGNPNNVTAAYYLSITFALAKDYQSANSLAEALLKVLPEEQKIKDLKAFIANQEKNFPNVSTSTAPTN